MLGKHKVPKGRLYRQKCTSIGQSKWKDFCKKDGKRKIQTFSFQASVPSSDMVIVWGAVSSAGVGLLVHIEGKLNGKEYLNLFRYRLRRYYPGLYDGSQIFQGDNAGPHNANIVNERFHKYSIQRLNWPLKSPDLNIIEDVWNKLKFERKKIFWHSRWALEGA